MRLLHERDGALLVAAGLPERLPEPVLRGAHDVEVRLVLAVVGDRALEVLDRFFDLSRRAPRALACGARSHAASPWTASRRSWPACRARARSSTTVLCRGVPTA